MEVSKVDLLICLNPINLKDNNGMVMHLLSQNSNYITELMMLFPVVGLLQFIVMETKHLSK